MQASDIYTEHAAGKSLRRHIPTPINGLKSQPQTLAFNPFIAQIGKRIAGHDEATSQIVQHNLNGEKGPGYVIEVHDSILAALAPGRTLEDMIKPFLVEASTYFEALVKQNEVDIFTWMRQMVTMCSTRAIYWPENPFNQNAKYSDLFWWVPLFLADEIRAIIKLTGPKAIWSQPECSHVRRCTRHTCTQRESGTLGTCWCIPVLLPKLCSWPDPELRHDSGTALCSNQIWGDTNGIKDA